VKFSVVFIVFDFSYAQIFAWGVGQMLSNPESFLSPNYGDFRGFERLGMQEVKKGLVMGKHRNSRG
jgi:hypothetical protein